MNCYWTTFETLAEIERDCKERQLDSVLEIGTIHVDGSVVFWAFSGFSIFQQQKS